MLSTKQLCAATRWRTLAKLTPAVVEDTAAPPGSVEEMVATDSVEVMGRKALEEKVEIPILAETETLTGMEANLNTVVMVKVEVLNLVATETMEEIGPGLS